MTVNEIITVFVVVAVIVLVVSVGMVDRKRRRRDGSGPRSRMSGALGTLDEIFHPNAAHAAEIREIQREIPVEAPAPEEPLGAQNDRRIVFRLAPESSDDHAVRGKASSIRTSGDTIHGPR